MQVPRDLRGRSAVQGIRLMGLGHGKQQEQADGRWGAGATGPAGEVGRGCIAFVF